MELFKAKKNEGHKHAEIHVETTIPDGYAGSTDGSGQSRVVSVRKGKQTNLVHVVRHSPDGFSWGFGGSGPADLALSILTHAVGKIVAETFGLYQDFKWEHVASWPQEGWWQVSQVEVLAWVKKKLNSHEMGA